MPKAIRFHLDENMPNGVADGLRKRHRDCTTTKDAGLLSVGDAPHIAYALSESRVVVTRDDDFLALDAEGVDTRALSTGPRNSTSDNLLKTWIFFVLI